MLADLKEAAEKRKQERSTVLQAVSGRADFGARLQVGGWMDGLVGAAGFNRTSQVGMCAGLAMQRVSLGAMLRSTQVPTMLCLLNLSPCCACYVRPAVPAVQAHMSFDCLDVEAHKDACQVIQLGINNNLSGEHAPKVSACLQ